MGGEAVEPTVLGVLLRRAPVLRGLAAKSATPATLTERLEASRSTVDRGLSELEAAGLIERIDGQYRTTIAGTLALAEFDRLADRIDDFAAAGALLGALPADASIDPRLLAGADLLFAGREIDREAVDHAVLEADTGEPVAALEALLETRSEAHHRAFVPCLDSHLVGAYTRAIRDGVSVEVALPGDAIGELLTGFRRPTADALESGRLALYETARSLPYALLIVENGEASDRSRSDRSPGDRASESLVVLVVCEGGEPLGLLANDGPAALEWARTKFASVRANARPLTLADNR
ncbi:helix-turn-helix transcriptional regulator [Halosolutus gelatinilyticus]|uniref:helix-turn-helix transcriptional regulator n=1 Tax=Halosolutus gelatinilyticus TaxID=2931975 RepID=UPI001FF6F013|nr:hypothetical protein [Halosolutus gelatinilyticus]